MNKKIPLELDKLNPSILDSKLRYAAIRGNVSLVKQLVEYGAKDLTGNILWEVLSFGKTSENLVRLLVKVSDVNYIDQSSGLNPVLLAVKDNSLDVIIELDKYGANFDHVDKRGLDIFDYAQKRFNAKGINSYLVNKKLDQIKKGKFQVDAKFLRFSCIFSRDDENIIDVFRFADKNLVESISYELMSNLADRNKFNVISEILDIHPCLLNTKDATGRSILAQCIRSEVKNNFSEVLIKNGADIHLEDRYGVSALFQALDNENETMLSIVSSVENINKYGNTRMEVNGHIPKKCVFMNAFTFLLNKKLNKYNEQKVLNMLDIVLPYVDMNCIDIDGIDIKWHINNIKNDKILTKIEQYVFAHEVEVPNNTKKNKFI